LTSLGEYGMRGPSKPPLAAGCTAGSPSAGQPRPAYLPGGLSSSPSGWGLYATAMRAQAKRRSRRLESHLSLRAHARSECRACGFRKPGKAEPPPRPCMFLSWLVDRQKDERGGAYEQRGMRGRRPALFISMAPCRGRRTVQRRYSHPPVRCSSSSSPWGLRARGGALGAAPCLQITRTVAWAREPAFFKAGYEREY
jgi:hypothetical protein